MTREESIRQKVFDNLPNLDVDEIWRTVGKFGRFQMIQFTIIYGMWWGFTNTIMSYIFVGYEPDHVCSMPNSTDEFQKYGVPDAVQISNATIKYKKCLIEIYTDNTTTELSYELDCVFGNNFSVVRETSILSDFDLVCDRHHIGILPFTLVGCGQVIGSMCASLADKFGRRPLQLWAHVALMPFLIGIAFADSFLTICIIKFISGFLQDLVTIVSYVPLVESVPKEHRIGYGSFGGIIWPILVLTMGGQAYISKDYSWRTQTLVLSISSIFIIPNLIFTEESLRWLLATDKRKQAMRLLEKICRTNKVPLENVLAAKKNPSTDDAVEMKLLNGEGSNLMKAAGTPSVPPSSKSESLKTFFTNIKMMRTALIVCFAWMFNVLIYYGLYLVKWASVTDRFASYSITAVTEIPVAPITWYIANRYNRRICSILFHFLAGVFLVISTTLSSTLEMTPTIAAVVTVSTMLGKACISATFILIFVLTPEVFPTNFRNTGFAMACFFGRVGGIIAPYCILMADNISWGPTALYAAACFVVSGMMYFIPETFDKELAQRAADMQSWGTENTNKHGRTSN